MYQDRNVTIGWVISAVLGIILYAVDNAFILG